MSNNVLVQQAKANKGFVCDKFVLVGFIMNWNMYLQCKSIVSEQFAHPVLKFPENPVSKSWLIFGKIIFSLEYI